MSLGSLALRLFAIVPEFAELFVAITRHGCRPCGPSVDMSVSTSDKWRMFGELALIPFGWRGDY
jgi:hypothetical protein